MENTSGVKKFLGGKSFTLVIVTVAVVFMFYFINKNYLSIDNIKTIFLAASLSGTIAVGMSCLLISGQIDLSSGAIGMFAGIMIAMLLKTGMPWIVSLIIVMAGASLIGLFNAFLANVLNFMSFISTLAVMTMLQGLANVITNAQNIAVSDKAFWMLGSTVLFNVIPLPFFIMLVIFCIFGFMLSSTKFGRKIYMCGGNRNAARLAGIDPRTVTTILFMVNAAISALAGSIMTARMHMASSTAVIGQEMTGITAAILGGVGFMGGSGGMLGAFIGLMLLNSFTNGLVVVGLGSYWQIVANGVLLIAALMLDFFREKSRIKSLKIAARAAAK